jgi:hypothetical protein
MGDLQLKEHHFEVFSAHGLSQYLFFSMKGCRSACPSVGHPLAAYIVAAGVQDNRTVIFANFAHSFNKSLYFLNPSLSLYLFLGSGLIDRLIVTVS